METFGEARLLTYGGVGHNYALTAEMPYKSSVNKMWSRRKYGRDAPKDRTYRAHKRNALAHFKLRWRNRLERPHGINMPPLDLMREELRKAMYEPGGSKYFTILSHRHDSTRLSGKAADGQDIVISFDHVLKVPVTVWLKKEYDNDYYKCRAAAETNSTELSEG